MTLKVPKPCACGESRLADGIRCESCQRDLDAFNQRRATARQAALEAAERRRGKVTDRATLIAQIDKLRSLGWPTREIARKLGTSHRMVIRVGQRDLVTGELPR